MINIKDNSKQEVKIVVEKTNQIEKQINKKENVEQRHLKINGKNERKLSS